MKEVPPWVDEVFASFEDEPQEQVDNINSKTNGRANGSRGSNTTSNWRDHVFTAAELQRRTFPAVSYCVPDLIPEGLTIIAGKPKIGKSWLALGCLHCRRGCSLLLGRAQANTRRRPLCRYGG